MRVEFDESQNNGSRRKKKKNSFRFHIVAFLMMVALSAVIALCLTIWFHIDRIEVVGDSVYYYEEIVAASGVKLDGNLFRVNKGYAVENIKKSLPYIADVKVQLRLPATVRISITPAVEYAYISQNVGALIVDENMKVLKEFSEPKGGLHLKGVSVSAYSVGEQLQFGNAEQSRALQELLVAVQNIGLNSGEFTVTMADVSDVLDLKFVLNDMYYVKVGSLNHLDKKLVHLKTMFAYIDKNKSGIINLADWTEENDRATFKFANIDEFK